MDATTTDLTGYMLGKLDKISEQIHGLEKLLLQPAAAAGQSATTKTSKSRFRIRSLSPFSQSLIAGGLFWILGICTRAYLARGGDPMALIELVVKSVL